MNKILGLVRALPLWTELLLVMLVCFGSAIVISVIAFATGTAFRSVEFSDIQLLETIIFELLVAALCISFLWFRDFKIWKEVSLRPTVKGVGIAIGLFLASYALYAILFNLIILAVGAEGLKMARYSISVSLPIVIALSVINPLFEETFVVGYLFARIKNINPAWIIALSVLIRVSYHLYQGWIGIISIAPMAVLFAITYWKTKDLFPLVLSHALMDFTGLSFSVSPD